LSAIGHPVVGDATYGGSRVSISLDRPFLHATHLAFDHPVTGERIAFDDPLPTRARRSALPPRIASDPSDRREAGIYPHEKQSFSPGAPREAPSRERGRAAPAA
jgi:hypothetical protein